MYEKRVGQSHCTELGANFSNYKVDSSSLLFINLTAAVISVRC